MSATARAFTVGDIRCISFSDGYLDDPGGHFGLNCLYLESGGRKILIDDGCGVSFQGPPGQEPIYTANPTAGNLVKNMLSEGLNPADITDIIFTHAHIDHAGGTAEFGRSRRRHRL